MTSSHIRSVDQPAYWVDIDGQLKSVEKETYVVTRNCCRSGNCFHCCPRGTHPSPFGKPVRIMLIVGLTKERAEEIAAGWSSHDARVEPTIYNDDLAGEVNL